jgi:hypothetical protein
MVNVIALYRGTRPHDLELVALTTDPATVEDLARRILKDQSPQTDPVLGRLDAGRRQALEALAHRKEG